MTDDVTNPHHAGQPPQKASNSLTLTFGLVSLPCVIYPGTNEPSTPKRHSFTDAGNPAGKTDYDKATGEPYKGKITKKATASDGTEVELTDEEIETVTGGRDGTAPIEYFVPLSAFYDGTYVIEDVRQIRPATTKVGAKKVPNASAAKGLNLVLSYLDEHDLAALIRFTPSRSYARWAAILPDGRLALLAFAEQVRPALPLPTQELNEREATMGRALLGTIEVAEPVLVNTVGAQLQEYVDKKAAAGGKVEETPVEPEDTGTVDLMAALELSLAAAKERKADANPNVPTDWEIAS